jgi:quercetin dioxygenase-like cupin family protein
MVDIRPRPSNEFPYDEFVQREGIPLVRAEVGIADVTQLPRADWARTGGKGTYVQLTGTFESERGIYVGEIPGGGKLDRERHLYEEQVFVLRGRGSAEVWQGSKNGEKLSFEWGEGSIFAFPRNTWHRLYNGSREPAVFMGVTTAPRLMNALGDFDVVFNCEYDVPGLHGKAGGEDYFHEPDARSVEGWYDQSIWHTNFIANVYTARVDPLERKIPGGLLTGYRMGRIFPHGHISEWPAGRYHKAHYHGPGAILLGLDGEGYVLAWPSALGPHPYQDGHADQVIQVNWGRHSIYSPPNAWFHQHFNSGAGPARHVAVYGAMLPLGVHGMDEEAGWKGFKSIREGGMLIEHEDEDPQIRADFEQGLAAKGIQSQMPRAVQAVQQRGTALL